MIKFICVVILPLAFNEVSAQTAIGDLSATSSPGQFSSQVFDWAAHNRFVEVFGGQRQQDYFEADTQGLTSNGVLDVEIGRQSNVGVALRWQTDNYWLVHLQVERQSGMTDYNGYLQAGNGSLTPYRARSGNTARQAGLTVGYALNASNWPAISPEWQVTPLLHISQHRWNRNLVQYSETYAHSNYAAGVLLQWRARLGTVVAVQALQGRTGRAEVSVPSLGFAAQQPGDIYRQWGLGLSQELAQLSNYNALAGWHLIVHFNTSMFAHNASPTVNALQAPPNQHRPSAWSLGLRKQF